MKTRTIVIEGKEYTRTVSEIFATDINFKNYIEPSDEFKAKAKELGIKEAKYILGQDIIDSDTKENLQLNWKIILEIVKEQYNNSWFEFIKDSGLVKLNGDKIDKSEFTSYYNNINWQSNILGNYGYIWLHGLDPDGYPIYVGFGEYWTTLSWNYPKIALRVASIDTPITTIDKQQYIGKTIYDYSDKECLGDSGTIIAVDIYDRYIIEFDNLKGDAFIFGELQDGYRDIRFEKEVTPEWVDNFMNELAGKGVGDIRDILLKHIPKSS